MNYNPYQYHYQGFQPPPVRPMAPAASTSYQEPYRSRDHVSGSRQTNYDMTWQHDMDEFERFLKDDKNIRKRSRSRSRSRGRNSSSFRSRSVGSDRSRHQSPRHKNEYQSLSPDRLSDLSTDSFYDTERLLRESSRLLQKGAETHGSVSPERKYGRGSMERYVYQRSSPKSGRSPLRGRSQERRLYQRSSLDRGQSPERGQYRKKSIDRGRSPEGGHFQRNSSDRGQSQDRWKYHRNSPGRRHSPGRGQFPRNSPVRSQSNIRGIYEQISPDGRNKHERRGINSPMMKDKDVRSRSSLDQYPPKRTYSPILDTLKELDRLEKELDISSRSRIEPSHLPVSANLRRGISGAILREDRSHLGELPRRSPPREVPPNKQNKTNNPARAQPRRMQWGKDLGKNNANLNSRNKNYNKNQGKNNTRGTNKNNLNQGKNNVNQKGGNDNNKKQGKKNNNSNIQSGKNNSSQQSGKNSVTKHRSERSISNEKNVKKIDEKKLDTGRSRSRNRSAKDKKRSPGRSDTSDKRRSSKSPHSAKRKRSESRGRSKDRKSSESKISKQTESSSKKLKVDDTRHRKIDKKSENDDKNKKSKNDTDSSKKDKPKSSDNDHEQSDKKLEEKKMVEEKMEETKAKSNKPNDKSITPEMDKTKTNTEKQEIKKDDKLKSKTVGKEESEKDGSCNKNEKKTTESDKNCDNSENSGNKTEESETLLVKADDKNGDMKKLADIDSKDSIAEKMSPEKQSGGKNEKCDQKATTIIKQPLESQLNSKSEKSSNVGETTEDEKEQETESPTKKGLLVGYKIPKLPKRITPEKTSHKMLRQSSRISEESNSDSDLSPYRSRKRSHSPSNSKGLDVHIIEGKTRKQILATSNAVVTTIKDSDPEAAERETHELLMKLLMRSQETKEEQGEHKNVIENVSGDIEKGKEREIGIEKTKENEVKPSVKEEPAMSNLSEGKTDEKSDRLAHLIKMSKEIEEEIKKLTGEGTSSVTTKEKSELETRTEKNDKANGSAYSKKDDNKSKNIRNETKQKEDENKTDQKSPAKEDISAADLDKVDLSSIQTKTLLTKLLQQSKMLEQQLEMLSSSGTSKSEVKDNKNETTVAKEDTAAQESYVATDSTGVATASLLSGEKHSGSSSKSSAVTGNSSLTAASKAVLSNPPVVSYSNSLQSLKKSTSSLASKGSQFSTPVIQVSAITSIESAPVEQVQTTLTKQLPTSKPNNQVKQPLGKQTVTANQNTAEPATKLNQVQSKHTETKKQVTQNRQNTNKEAQKPSCPTTTRQTTVGGQTMHQNKHNVSRQQIVQPVRPNFTGNRPVNPVTQAGIHNRPMVSHSVPSSTYFPTRPTVHGPSLTPLMSIPLTPAPQAVPSLFLSAASSNQASAPIASSTISVSNKTMTASQNNSYQPMMSGPNSNQPVMGGPNSSQPIMGGPNSNWPISSASTLETVASNQRHQSGRNLQNIVSVPQVDFTRQAKNKNPKYMRATNARPELTNVGMNKDLSKGRNIFPDTGDQLESSLLSNIKDTDQQLYIRSLWGDGGIGQSDSTGRSSFSGNISLMSNSDIGFGDEKMAAGSNFGEGFGGGPLDPGPGRSKLRCMNCGDIGHVDGNCKEPKPPFTDVQCYQCQQHGHKSFDCPFNTRNKKKLATKKPCYECGEKGHLAKDCPWTRCFNCGGLGHKARDCNSANIGEELEDIWCQFCGQDGHFDSNCPKKKNRESEATEEMLAKHFKENELKRLKMYLLNLNNKRKMKSSPVDILVDACKYLNLGLRFKFETSVVTRIDNIELLSAALKMSGDIFLARVFGYNRQILKSRLYEKALEVLISEPESLIIEEQDPGAHGYRITKDIYDDVCEKAAQDNECQKFLIRVATQPDTKDEFFIQKIEELRQENKISQYTVIAALRERHKLIYEKMNTATLSEILSNPDVESNATDLFQIGKNPHEPWKVLDKFVIMEKEDLCDVRKSHAFDILFYSAYRNGMLLQWWNRCIYTKAPNIYKCNIWLQNQPIGEAYTINKEEAKKLAAADALSNLYKRLPAIRIVTAGNHKTKLWVTYREVYEKADALRTANMNLSSPFERWIIQVCNEIILDYIKRTTLESLEFKPGFSDIEIAEIRTLSSSKGLNYQLRKDPTGMTVVIDKELHPMDMLDILRQNGGVSGLYSVVSAFECENIGKQMEIGNLLTVKDTDD